MLILILHPQQDPAGAGLNLYKAIKKYTTHEVRHVVGHPTFLFQTKHQFVDEHDVVLSGTNKNCNKEELEVLINKADVLHFSQWDWTEKVMYNDYTFGDLMHRKDQKLIFQGHGGAWLLDPDKRMEMYKSNNVKVITCSPIDEQVIPGAEWMPNILGLDTLDFTPNWERDFEGTLIASLANVCPVYKGGEIVDYVFEYLKRFGYKIEFHTLKIYSKKDCIKIRKLHHITVDNWVQGFFGYAAMEGLALGHIAFARSNDLAIRNWSKKFDTLPPVDNVIGMDECAKRVRWYYNNRNAMKERAIENREWIDKNYTDEKIIKIWENMYEK